MADKPRKHNPPMLWDGLPDAIRNIRKRKDLKQVEAAERGGVSAGKWSEYETRTKRLGPAELPIVTDGLGVTETELWQEKVREESLHYEGQPDEVREPAYSYGSAMVTAELRSLHELESADLPSGERQWFEEQRHFLAAALSNLFNMSVHLERRYRELKRKERKDSED